MDEYSDLTPLQQSMIRMAMTKSTHSDTVGIIDSDVHFTVDTINKIIISPGKKKLVQFSHNSERITFDCERYIEGHDIMNCNVVQIHYLNDGIYDIDDLTVNEDDDSKVTFTWLISGNVTKEVINEIPFSLILECTEEDGTCTYSWETEENKSVYVVKSRRNSQNVTYKYADVLEQWDARLEEVEKISNEIADLKDESNQYVKSVNGFEPDEDGVVEIKYPVKTEKKYRHENLSVGQKAVTVYSDEKYTNEPYIFFGENYFPETSYLAGKYSQHGLTFDSDKHNITVKGTATATSAFRLALSDGGDMYWSLPSGLSVGDRVILYVFAKQSETRTPCVYVYFYDDNNTKLGFASARVKANDILASGQKVIPTGTTKVQFAFEYNNGETHDSTFFPVLVKTSTEIINNLSFSEGKADVTTENNSSVICTAPYTSAITHNVGLKDYIDNSSSSIDLEAIEALQKKSFVTPEEFGAYANTSKDDTEALQACIDYAIKNGKKIIGGGEYATSKPLIIKGDQISLDIKKIIYSGDDCAVILSGSFCNISINYIGSISAVGFRLNSAEDGAENSYNEIYIGRVNAGKNAVEYISSAYDIVSNNLTFGALRSGKQYNCIYHSPFQQQLDGGANHGNNNFTGGLLEVGLWGVYNARHQDTYMTCRFEGVTNCIHQSCGGVVRVIAPRYVEIFSKINKEENGLFYDISDIPYSIIPSSSRISPFHYFTLDGASGVLTTQSIDISNAPTRKIYTRGTQEVEEPLNKNIPGANIIHERLQTDYMGAAVAKSFMIFGNHILVLEPTKNLTKHITSSDSGYMGDYRTTGNEEAEFFIYSTYIVDENGCEYTLPPSYDIIAFNHFTIIQPEGTSCIFKDWRGTPIFNGEEYGTGAYDIRITTDNPLSFGDYDNNHQIWEIRRMSDYSLVDTMPHDRPWETV